MSNRLPVVNVVWLRYLEQFQLPMKWAKKMTKAWRKDVNENEVLYSFAVGD